MDERGDNIAIYDIVTIDSEVIMADPNDSDHEDIQPIQLDEAKRFKKHITKYIGQGDKVAITETAQLTVIQGDDEFKQEMMNFATQPGNERFLKQMTKAAFEHGTEEDVKMLTNTIMQECSTDVQKEFHQYSIKHADDEHLTTVIAESQKHRSGDKVPEVIETMLDSKNERAVMVATDEVMKTQNTEYYQKFLKSVGKRNDPVVNSHVENVIKQVGTVKGKAISITTTNRVQDMKAKFESLGHCTGEAPRNKQEDTHRGRG